MAGDAAREGRALLEGDLLAAGAAEDGQRRAVVDQRGVGGVLHDEDVVALRKRDGSQQVMAVDEFVALVQDRIQTRSAEL